MSYLQWSEKYDQVRPYYTEEVEPAVKRIAEDPLFFSVLRYLYDEAEIPEVLNQFKFIKTIEEFQTFFSLRAVRKTLSKTTDGLSFSGVENLEKDKAYLFVANHRDIVLDSAIMQSVLLEHGYATSQITMGSNLLYNQLIEDLGKLNRMFVFTRDGDRVEQYENSKFYAKYIHHVINERKESIWIAQRGGRTKNGSDKTQTGLLKMFVSGRNDVIDALHELNIVPVSISYEYEPCDSQKVWESYVSAKQKYVKAPDEDLKSILAGIKNPKGHVHIAFGQPITPVLEQLQQESKAKNAVIADVAADMDRQIFQDYKLWPTNYVAFDLLNDSEAHAAEYTEANKNKFVEHMEKTLQEMEGNADEIRETFLKLYANPVINKEKVLEAV